MKAYVNVMMTVVLLIGCLAVTGELGRAEAGRISPDARRADGEASKLSLKFCVHRDCHTKAEPIMTACFCCVGLPDIPCYSERDECKEECPNTNKTPARPASAVGDVRKYQRL
ncbi:uncharacterized protein LOC123417309 [Hordeum vulgare subsp. vulgare]|uniref:uncharacterized protein LOC123417309 n=1 Tax=Hordeum vulgare subsp. vulgare TaxID=112509 RepID=UPI001D1A4C45|nr:uncharacterized protein LOC123417309 [Hordeum vulgare subsp. vulgare]